MEFADAAGVRHRIVFLPDYDIGMAQALYPGCDIWLNNPPRTLEACGTSRMKAALNGALNVSIRDGWWTEWFDGATTAGQFQPLTGLLMPNDVTILEAARTLRTA